MRTHLLTLLVFLSISTWNSGYAVASRWGVNYFPNVALLNQEGETFHFFDDLIKNKIVAINFIYTKCPDSCPLETAQLVKVQDILGDRLGKDIFFYSISIDPANDTPSVLKAYRERFGARWSFFTGEKSDVIKLRKKLGLYINEIQDDSNNHNVTMIIGNQATGRWMKRAPFENPHVLADQLTNWLTGWKSPPRGRDYANAPKLRSISRAEQIFRTRCFSCHSLSGIESAGALGPDLLGVTQKRDKQWLLSWLKAPDQMLKDGDPIALALYRKYNNLAMPNMRLNKDEALILLEYISAETKRISGASHQSPEILARNQQHHQHKAVHSHPLMSVALNELDSGTMRKTAFVDKTDFSTIDVVAVMNAWVREAHPDSTVNAGYMTLVNVGLEPLRLKSLESEIFDQIEVHDMVAVDGIMEMRQITDLVILPNDKILLVPGGRHLMMMGPRTKLQTGQQVKLTLTFESGKQQNVMLPVKNR